MRAAAFEKLLRTIGSLEIDVAKIHVVFNFTDLAVFRIALGLIPFGAVVEPAQKEGAQGGSVGEDEQGIHAVLFVVSVDGAHELVDADCHVKGAFS